MSIWDNIDLNEPFEGPLLEEINGVALPADYLEFIKEHNGCEGDAGSVWFILYRHEELTEINQDYEVEEYLPNTCIIGGNGGGELFGVDDDGNYFTVPDMIDEDDKIVLGKTLQEFIENLNDYFSE